MSTTGLSAALQKESRLIAEAVRERAHGAIHSLMVTGSEEGFLIRGNAPSHYTKQLAIAAANAATQSFGKPCRVDIAVVSQARDD